METLPDAAASESTGWTAGLAAPVGSDDCDLEQLALTFAVTPEAARLAVARVGTDFRALQRELGGRR